MQDPPGVQSANVVWTVSTHRLQQGLGGAEDGGAPASDSKVDGESEQKLCPPAPPSPERAPEAPCGALKNLEKEQNAKLARGRKS